MVLSNQDVGEMDNGTVAAQEVEPEMEMELVVKEVQVSGSHMKASLGSRSVGR